VNKAVWAKLGRRGTNDPLPSGYRYEQDLVIVSIAMPPMRI